MTLQIKKYEANFVLNARKLLIELQEGTIWGWDAVNEPHGTTLSQFTMTHGSKITASLVKNQPEIAQQTAVFTIPTQVGRAYRANAPST